MVDNSDSEHARALIKGRAKAHYVLATDAVETAVAKNRRFAESLEEAVPVLD